MQTREPTPAPPQYSMPGVDAGHEADPCKEVTCSGLGHCAPVDGSPTCVCDANHHAEGLACVSDDPCQGVSCGSGGSCRVDGGNPVCVCSSGYKPVGLACVACGAGIASKPGLVATAFGVVQGQKTGNVYRFLGVPFAAPPVGPLRWLPPQDPACWDAPLQAATFPPACTQKQFSADGSQPGTIIGAEDCLYLNVWTRDGYDGQSRPVMVFMHGGGNVQGSTSEETQGATMYDGAKVADRGDAVVVTAEYRLGPLGFLAHSALADADGHVGNWGLLDQMQALRWVQRNIAAFGGDPTRVLLFGESAGALDTCALVASPLAAGLFSRALMESGACVSGSLADREAQASDYLTQVGCGSAGDVNKCLRDLSAEALFAPITQPTSEGVVTSLWGPTVDGWVLAKAPQQAVVDGSHNHVPLVVGTNADEMAISVQPGTVSPAKVQAAFHQFPSIETRLLALYPPGTGNAPTEQARDAYIQATTDAQFTCNARRILRAAQLSQTEPAWRYFFSHKLSGVSGTVDGSYHGLELFFVFGTLEDTSYAPKITAGDTAVESALLGYWTRFAATGDPNGGGALAWPRYDATDPYLQIEPTLASSQALRADKCDAWDSAR